MYGARATRPRQEGVQFPRNPFYAWIAQLVERRIEAPGVGSSSLSPGTIAHWIRLLIPVLAVDVRARTLGYSETIRARSTRCIRATVKQYARLAWVYLWSLERVIDL